MSLSSPKLYRNVSGSQQLHRQTLKGVWGVGTLNLQYHTWWSVMADIVDRRRTEILSEMKMIWEEQEQNEIGERGRKNLQWSVWFNWSRLSYCTRMYSQAPFCPFVLLYYIFIRGSYKTQVPMTNPGRMEVSAGSGRVRVRSWRSVGGVYGNKGMKRTGLKRR